jgi:hypothetical protein
MFNSLILYALASLVLINLRSAHSNPVPLSETEVSPRESVVSDAATAVDQAARKAEVRSNSSSLLLFFS